MFDFIRKADSQSINVNDLDKLFGKVEIIDIREPFEYVGGSLPTAKNIPMDNLLASPEKYLTKDKIYYILCQSGARSGITTRTLVKQGFKVTNVAGGMAAYTGAGINN